MSVAFTPKALRSVPYLLSAKLVTFVVYFFVSVMVVKALSPEDYGILALSKNFGQYMVIVCALGLNTCILRYVPEIEVKRDYLGIKSFLIRSLGCQFLSWLLCIGVLYLVKVYIFEYLTTDSPLLLEFIFLWILAWVVKNTVTDSLTALFEVKTVAFIALIQSIMIYFAVWWVCSNDVKIEYILGVELFALAFTSMIGFMRLRKRLAEPVCEKSTENNLPVQRVLALATPVWFNGLLRSLMLQYTEVFILAYCFLPEIAGFYELGYSLPLLAITFIPMALQTLFSSAFAEAYQRDKTLLPKMVRSMFKVLILLSIPLAFTGFLFSEQLVAKIYGEDMSSAGYVAKYFSLIHILPLISMPLSMAVTTLEKNSKTVGLLILQVTINIALDIILIPNYGLSGAIAAVILTFSLTIPIRLLVIRRLIGGIWFPAKFFLKIIASCLLLAIPFSFIPQSNTLLGDLSLAILYLASCAGVLHITGSTQTFLEFLSKKNH
ncbi:oligosaccharide flippase family protein [Lentisphaera profundi]|uniref:Oligosaccharide flippase family protein n=1 Tax=Lentisphaera profundi TaxID=1658616 RepID=A0ABY7VXM2_9BACT|nr:oligosaccharide flippase family protein [Lentisphaera profundi]WDE98554.1 oligosaccharide flippase family protein [Lentisphaera profundi]